MRQINQGVVIITFNRAAVEAHIPTSKVTLTTSDAFILSHLTHTLQETEQLVRNYTLGNSIPFLLWNDLLNKHTLGGVNYGTYRLTNPAGQPRRFSDGRKVFVDFGYGLDRELFQPHPAIVLGDFGEILVVAPTESDDGRAVLPDIEKALIRIPSDAAPGVARPIFPRNTIIKLHQIRHISKNRVRTDLGCSAKDYIVPSAIINNLNSHLPYPALTHGNSLYQVIMVKLSHLYAPDSLFEIKRLNAELDNLRGQIASLTNQIEQLKQTAAGSTE